MNGVLNGTHQKLDRRSVSILLLDGQALATDGVWVETDIAYKTFTTSATDPLIAADLVEIRGHNGVFDQVTQKITPPLNSDHGQQILGTTIPAVGGGPGNPDIGGYDSFPWRYVKARKPLGGAAQVTVIMNAIRD